MGDGCKSPPANSANRPLNSYDDGNQARWG